MTILSILIGAGKWAAYAVAQYGTRTAATGAIKWTIAMIALL